MEAVTTRCCKYKNKRNPPLYETPPRLSQRNSTTVDTTRSHCGIEVKERADLLSKRGTLIKRQNITNVPFHSLKITQNTLKKKRSRLQKEK
jgi:hypothetical protein